ncbi:MAG: ParB/RepB/Spo0J family partition protein [bacterium]|nr:ParB/RepB/Spo0J family partition protein [bacterium]
MPGLARGLGSLIPQKESLTAQVLPQTQEGFEEVPVEKIVENPYQPRTHFSASGLEDLMTSIKEHGIMVPIIVTSEGNGYELIAGERRLRAARSLGLKTVPAIVRSASSQQKLELALIENIQRQQLGALEEAVAYRALIDEFNLTQVEAAERVGKSRSEVANTIRLLDLPDDVKQALAEGKITRSAARTLLAEKDPKKLKEMFQAMISGRMTVRDAESSVRGSSKSNRSTKDPNLQAHEQKLREILGTKVEISERAGKGKMTIHFYSKAELSDLIQQLTE